MNQQILEALMRLFAIIATANKEGVSENARVIVTNYLSVLLSKADSEEFITIFDDYINAHNKKLERNRAKGRETLTSLNSVKVLVICEDINTQLQQEEKLIVLFRLFEFVRDQQISDEELDFIKTVSDIFNISREEYDHINSFTIGSIQDIDDKTKILLIDNNSNIDESNSTFRHICDKQLHGRLTMLYVKSTNSFVLKYDGDDTIYMNSENILPHKSYFFDDGSIIKGQKMTPIYHSDVARKFIHSLSETKIVFNAKNIEYFFKNSTNGIQKFDFCEESGRLIGIMGGSGVGKSTLLNVLNGSYKVRSGTVKINGYDIYEDKEHLKGVIGFVTQDDLLIEELTVFQNLYYNAKLCFSGFNEEQITKVAEKVLDDLELTPTRDLTVGNSLNKFISGGQRKRLNIALELMREPSILIVDEPTSGLSSMDSDMVMSLLKEQTIKGKLVIVNIHQPSTEIYKLFDRLLMMDKGGHPVYYGSPVDAITYFKKAANYVNSDESECGSCGSVNPELPLQILEAKIVDEHGRFTKERKIDTKEWYEAYKTKIEADRKGTYAPDEKIELPENFFKVPSRLKQFLIFSIRNIRSKLTNKQFLLITFLEAPLLAIILGYFTKYIAGTPLDPNEYVFAENVNLTAYMFMAVTVALFFGLTLSAEEIIKDRKILKREKFLNLSKVSYLNSKIIVLFGISAIQTLSFILVGNYILEIQGMTLTYWLILFSTAAFANILGLNISAALDSIVTIYITIPFILIPQLLFSGTIIDFTKLHPSSTSVKYVPLIGDLMTTRWAYEALVVAQFQDNDFQKNYFDVDQRKSELSFKKTFLIDELESRIAIVLKNQAEKKNQKQTDRYIEILQNEIQSLEKFTEKFEKMPSFNNYEDVSKGKFTEETAEYIRKYFRQVRKRFGKLQYTISSERDKITTQLIKKLGSKEAYYELEKDFKNKRLDRILRNKTGGEVLQEEDGVLVQMMDPVYKMPVFNNGRAQFYAPKKKIGGFEINTLWFNVIFIWFGSLIVYLTLVFDVFRKLLNFMGSFKIFGKKKR